MNWRNILTKKYEFDLKSNTSDDEFDLKSNTSDVELRYIFDETLFHRFDIDTNTEYKFYYDDFFQHVLDDTDKVFSSKKSRVEKFKSQLMTHMFSTQFPLLKNPENSPEIKQLLRLKKLKKLQNEI